ncbi:MAG: hypothetical protein KDN22_01245 [Verrucomicrobiae bacterium]|nr:hypothetical protein [Verrucomicrobiae bacterium]
MLHLWDIISQQEIARFTGHSGDVQSVAFSPDGTRVLSGSTDRSLRMWTVGVSLSLPVGERFQRIHDASFKLYPYQLKGFHLEHRPFQPWLNPVGSYRFPTPRADQPYDKLRYQRPAGTDLVDWILKCSTEWE